MNEIKLIISQMALDTKIMRNINHSYEKKQLGGIKGRKMNFIEKKNFVNILKMPILENLIRCMMNFNSMMIIRKCKGKMPIFKNPLECS
jgi:hypothetical protein